MSELDFLLGNGIGWLLKNKWSGFNSKLIPIGLFVWNTLYHALKVVAPEQVPEVSGASVIMAGFFGDFFGAFGGLFADAAIDTAKQMAVHSFAKNTFAQAFIPMAAKGLKDRYGSASRRR